MNSVSTEITRPSAECNCAPGDANQSLQATSITLLLVHARHPVRNALLQSAGSLLDLFLLPRQHACAILNKRLSAGSGYSSTTVVSTLIFPLQQPSIDRFTYSWTLPMLQPARTASRNAFPPCYHDFQGPFMSRAKKGISACSFGENTAGASVLGPCRRV